MKRERARRVTLKAIAEKTGYSAITISKALRGSNDLADATIRRIRETADEMGYVANSAANALRSGRTGMIALTLVDVSNPFWSRFAKKVDAIAREAGYTLLIMSTDMDGDSEAFAIRNAVQHGVDGLIIDPSVSYRENVHLLQKMDIPFVIAGYLPDEDKMDAVFFDEYQVAYLAGKRFAALGLDRLLMLNLPAGLPATDARAAGIRDALAQEGLPPDAVLIDNVPNGEGECIRVLKELLEKRPDTNGILTYSDHRALEVADELMDIGVRIPEDIALIGCGNQKAYLRTPFSLTTADAEPTLLARHAAELLLQRIQEDHDHPTHIRIPVDLIIRKSC